MKQELLFKLRKKDFVLEFYKASGKGGQKRNKCETAVRIKHPASGAIAHAEDERSQNQNKKIAFERLVKTKEFINWHRLASARAMGIIENIEDLVNRWMDESNIKIEIVDPKTGNWIELGEGELSDNESDN